MKNLKRKIKKNARKILASFLMMTTIAWSFGISLMTFVPVADAAFGYDIRYIDDGGSTPDVFLNSADTAELVLAIEAFESVDAANTNKITAVTLEIMDATSPGSGSPTGFTNTDLTEVALYLDVGGDNSFVSGTDTLIDTSSPSAWTPLANPARWQYTFSGLNITIPTSYSSSNANRILVTAKAASGSLDQAPLKGFHFQVPQNGIQVSVDSGASLTNFPSSINFFPPVNLGTEGTGGYGSPIVISEIQTAGDGGVNDEFIELYNRSPGPIELTNYKIVYNASDVAEVDLVAGTGNVSISGGTIPANGFYLVAHTGYGGTADATYSAFSLAESGGFVSLVEETSSIDLVGYGSLTNANLSEGGQPASAPPQDGSIERKAFSDSTVAKMITGGIHASQGNGEDTSYNVGDFILRDALDNDHKSNPQNSTSDTEASGGGPGSTGSSVVINEIFYNTATGGGWIELYNRDTTNQDIAGWKLSAGGNTYTLPTGNDATIMLSGGFITIHWNSGDSANDDTTSAPSSTLYTGIVGFADLGTYGGDALLTLGDNTIKDYVQYGGSGFTNETPANNAGEWMIGDHVPNCLYGESIGRQSINGDDYNGSGDWQFYSATSPGNPNMGGDSTAPTKVTSVTLADEDTTNYGANGDDVKISWIPSTISDPTFDRYELYLLLSTVSLDVDSHSPIDMIYGQYEYNSSGNQLETYTYNGGGFISNDSAGGVLDTGAYVAYVVAVDFAGNESATAMSSTPTGNNLTAEDALAAGGDTQKPFIMHMGVWQAKADANIVLVSGFDDDRGLSTAQVVYKTGVTWQTAVDCEVVAIDSVNTIYYTCTIPSSAAVAETEVSYYLKSTDATGNVAYMSASPENDMTTSVTEETIKGAPFIIDILTADGDAMGDYTDDLDAVDLSGNIYKSDGSVFANDEQPKLFLEGTAIGIITPANNSAGLFEFPDNTLTPGAYFVVVFKNGYMDSYSSMFKGDTGLSIYLNEGNMNMTGGADGGYIEMPYVAWTSPMDGMMGAPTDIYCASDCTAIGAGEMPIIIAFSKEMNENTINDSDASNAGSNIYLTPDGGNTRMAGKVKYVYNNTTGINEARFYAETHNTLTAGNFYSIVVTQNVTDINGASMQGGAMSDGSFSNSFNTMMDNSSMWGEGWTDYYEEGGDHYGDEYGGEGDNYGGMDFSGYGGGGMMMPPYVKGTTPQPGAFGVDINTSVVVEFSEPMNSSSITADSIKLYRVTDENSWILEATAVQAAVTLDQATQRIVTLNPTNNLDLNASNSGWYVLKIMGSVKSASGIWLGDPGSCGAANPDTYLATQPFYESDFQLNSDADGDTGAPTIMGTYPSADATGVEVGIAAIDIGFSEPMLPSTINAQNITLKAGSSAVTGKVKYDPMANSAKYIPTNALLANTQYTLTISASVQDLASVALTAHSINFRTGAADTTSPEILYANADDYSIAITFSEPMNIARQTDTNRWSSSVLNSANYYVKGLNGATPVAPYTETTQLSAVSGGSFSFEYDEGSNTVTIEGFDFFPVSGTHATDFQIYLDNVKDKSNNLISGGDATGNGNYDTDLSGGNATQGPVQNSTDTYGMLGPGGGGMMMMGPMGGGTMGGPGMNMGDMGMMGGGVFPMNMMAGQTSMYFVDVPLTSQIVSGGKIVLTFPSGFDVTNAIADPYSPINNDINEWGPGIITIADVDPVQSSRTITITTGGDDTQVNDFLHFDLKGIVNSSLPKEFGTDGYTVDIKTMSAAGVLLENISTMPFYIQQGGTNTISGTITATSHADTGTMIVYLGSSMTGPMETTTSAFSSGTATYSFDNLPDGNFHVFTDPFLTINSVDYLGNMMPEPVWLSGNDDIKNIVLEKEGATGAPITVTLTGNFATSGVADDVDIFANSPTGFRVKTVTPSDDGVNNTTSHNYTMYLPTGNWMIGIGPAMPKGPMAGPPTMPDWMPPMQLIFTATAQMPAACHLALPIKPLQLLPVL